MRTGTLLGSLGLMVIMLVSSFLMYLTLDIYRVSGSSMEPTLYEDDLVLLLKSSNLDLDYTEDDIIILKHNNKQIIKRIKEIRDNEYYILGDNLSTSIDSRELGWISEKEILGKAIYYKDRSID